MNPKLDDLPYRPCAGIMLANTEGKVFVGQRIDKAPEGDAWQMPQGGIDDGEDAEQAALRELTEETGISPELVDVIARSRNEHFYDLPDELLGKIWKGKYRGQRQWWFLMRFKGTDSEIDIQTDHPEFSRWQWVTPDRLPQLIVPFKRRLYESLVTEFGELI
ncbi:RNA pyrophosphohydrolase [Sphingorhabdus sp. IMCC26285]|jgi:putative (di)nucleoside polyphosphate hydrolase|uniref:RNA pyrophosphohydrolase n=1 Tax=Sphingorhabdus profundilacus TaxID=2509718 RepID=A0A6I4LYT2_9SPHN|nr:RNA pyrophosphohydrolase [Sphingorhabdus profundilacus]MVZ97236.1 RNA pyrophosphohydrolase [Sphingorhabdus profundilacus]